MKKIVNNKVVNIENMELFELAAEGLALRNTTTSNTSDGIDDNINSPLVKKYIKQYDLMFKTLPYPLYSIEKDIKYATIGSFMKFVSKRSMDMWVDNGLYIRLDKESGMTLRIVNCTWGIIYDKAEHKDNIQMSEYKEQVGYEEYSWILNKVLNKESTATFYNEFMPDFIKACNNQEMIIKWELENMLTFCSIPERTCFKQNKIIDIDNNKEYSIDIYCTGTVQSDEKIQTISLVNGIDDSIRNKQIKTYGFDAYSKPMSEGAKTSGKLEKCSITGLHNLFAQLCAIKTMTESSVFSNFEGIISDANMVFTIDKKLYVTKSRRIMDPKDIAHGVELYTVDNNKVYFIKSKKINDVISKDTLYSYSLNDGAVRLCKILFTY